MKTTVIGHSSVTSFDSSAEMWEHLQQIGKQVRERKPTPLENYPEPWRPIIESAAAYMKIAYDVKPNGNFRHSEKKRSMAEDQLRLLGEAIDATGGFGLMQSVYAAIEDVYPNLRYSFGGAMRCLECTWDGIGDWQG